MQGRRLLLALSLAGSARCAKDCGLINVTGYNTLVSIITTKWNTPGDPAGDVRVENGKVVPYMSGRSYFGDACTVDSGFGRLAYNNSEYVAWMLLGRRLQYTVNMSGANCGCNAALYLTSLRQNTDRSECFDYYCDANSVCGVRCAEIDIQEANEYSWHSTLHVAIDGSGGGGGVGGGETGAKGWTGPRDWTTEQYGPGGTCIDTKMPFQVTAAFPVDDQGNLVGMDMTLSQEGKDCPLKLDIHEYTYKDENGTERSGMPELTAALGEGMAPIISYWKSKQMMWLDGKGTDGEGPCDRDSDPTYAVCGDSVAFYGFSLSEIPPEESGLKTWQWIIIAVVVASLAFCCFAAYRATRPEEKDEDSESDESS